MNSRAALLIVLAAVAACSTPPPRAATETFDERTGTTLLAAGKPIVFARSRSDVAANSRDYATLLAVEVDRSGEYSQFLVLHRWSTVDTRMASAPTLDEGLLRIVADGRVITLAPLPELPFSLEQREALRLPAHGAALSRAYRVDADLLRFIALSRQIVVRLPEESVDLPFLLWDDQRSVLMRFLQQTSGT